MPSDLRTAFRGVAQFWRWALAGLFFLAGCPLLVNASTPLALNYRNLTWVHNLCWDDDCVAFSDGRLMLRSGANLDSLLRSEASPCQQLWVSRLRMAESSQAALDALNDVERCPRPNLVAAWQGQLAWHIGNLQDARDKLRKLPPNILSEWGYELLLQGDVYQGRFMLDAALDAAGPSLPTSQRYRLLMNLGHSYRLERSWARAVEYYQDAQSLAPEDAEIAFYLGMSLRENRLSDQAIAVLEGGLPHLPMERAYFITDYYVQLALAYWQSGRQVDAISAIKAAQASLARDPAPSQGQRTFVDELQRQFIREAGK